MKKQILFIGLCMWQFMAQASSTCGNDLGNNCWDCGKTASDSCTARLEGSSLTITGDGYMADYWYPDHPDSGYPNRPWGDNITSVNISEGIKSIGESAFRNTQLTELNIPSSVENIGRVAFQYCDELENVSFSENSELKTIGIAAFNSDSKLNAIDIPSGVSVIGSNAFNRTGIDYLVLPDALFFSENLDLPQNDAPYFEGLNLLALSDVKNVYCSKASQAKCEQYFNQAQFWENGTYYPIKDKSTLAIYTSSSNKYFVNGKWYDTLSDMNRDNPIKKRIYTVDEANLVSGKKNKVSIRYR